MARVSSREYAEFYGLLASAVERGVALEPAVALLAGQRGDSPLRAAAADVARALREGVPLGEALALHPKVFPPETCALLRAGLEGGRLAEVLRHSRTYHELRARVARRFWRLGFYLGAGVLLCGLVFVTLVRMGRGFEAVYVPMKMPLPFITSLFLWTSRHLWVLAFGAAAAAGLYITLRAAVRHRVLAARAVYWVPLWGGLQRDRNLSLFCSVLALRIRTSGTLTAALAAAAEALPNRFARRAAEQVRKRVEEGESFSSALYYVRFFPRALAWAVSMAEARGELPETLDTFARIYERDLELRFELLFQAVTPLGILALANVVLVSVAALLMPLVVLMDGLGSRRTSGSLQQEAAALLPALFVMNAFLLIALATVYGLVVRRRAKLSLFVEHLAALTGKGMPIQAGLRALGQDLGGSLGLDVGRLGRRLEEGRTLGEAMERHSRSFPPLLRMLVAMGESGGHLAASLEEARRSFARQAELPHQSPYFFMYPLALSVALNVAIAAIHRIIVPKYHEIMRQLQVSSGADRWWPLLSAANQAMLTGVVLLAGFILFGHGVGHALSGLSRGARRAVERLLAAVPVLGKIRNDAAVHRFALSLGLFLRAGSTLPEAARAAAQAEPGVLLQDRYAKLAARLAEGLRLSEAAREGGVMPEDLLWFVETGEASAALPDHLIQGALHYDTKSRLSARLAARAAIPIFVIANGALVLLTCLLTFLPLRDMIRGILPW